MLEEPTDPPVWEQAGLDSAARNGVTPEQAIDAYYSPTQVTLPKGDELKAVIGMIEPGLVVLLLIRRERTSTLWRITEVYWLPPSQHEHFWKELS